MQMRYNDDIADITPYWEDNGNADIPPNQKDIRSTADIPLLSEIVLDHHRNVYIK